MNQSKIAANRLVILCFVAHYLPGSKSGGPVRTITNFVDRLGDEFDIRIVCYDHDFLSVEKYYGIRVDAWNTVGNAQVFYASDKTMNLRGIAKLISNTPHHVLYLNSFFGFYFTILPLVARWLRMLPSTPCIIAPRGEFSSGAVSLKAIKKRMFLWIVGRIGLYRNIIWQASSDFEKTDILREFGRVAKNICVAPHLPALVHIDSSDCLTRKPGPLRLIFLSRISPKKNLDFLLRVLEKFYLPVDLGIFGPLEDSMYWNQCENLLKVLPHNVTVKIGGHVQQEDVRSLFGTYDLFAFPTRGENYGHVIFEALSAGTPVIVSDQTPWEADNSGGLEVLSLEETTWLNSLSEWASLDDTSLRLRRQSALQYAARCISNATSAAQNKELFTLAAAKKI